MHTTKDYKIEAKFKGLIPLFVSDKIKSEYISNECIIVIDTVLVELSKKCEQKLSCILPQMLTDSGTDLGTGTLSCTDSSSNSKTSFTQLEEVVPKAYLDVVHKYDMLTKLAEGSYGQIYKTRNIYTNKEVVMKVQDKTDETYESITNEINILSHLTHSKNSQYVSHFIDAFDTTFSSYLVLEYLNTYCTLDTFKITKKNRDTIISNICLGLRGVHEMNVVHRDVKPENIMIDSKTLNTKYIDFGLSCYGDKCETLRISGSPYFMAPELLYSHTKPFTFEVLKKSDLWSLGMSIFEIVTRKIYYVKVFETHIIPHFNKLNKTLKKEIETDSTLNDYTCVTMMNRMLSSDYEIPILPYLTSKTKYLNTLLSSLLIKSPLLRKIC